MLERASDHFHVLSSLVLCLLCHTRDTTKTYYEVRMYVFATQYGGLATNPTVGKERKLSDVTE